MSRVVVVTGASGFVGRAVCRSLLQEGHQVRAMMRQVDPGLAISQQVIYEGLHDEEGLRRAMRGADSVVHLAARVHQMRESVSDSVNAYRRVNVEGTRLLAQVAADEGAGEFIFASSVKAAGESNERPWKESDAPRPMDPYGRSKLEAEGVLEQIGADSGMRTTALRLPLVYGPGVKANMLRLFELVDRGRPLPVGGIRNSRSLLYVENLASAIVKLVGDLPRRDLYYVSDGEDVSTPELVRRIGLAMGRNVRFFPVPGGLLRLLTRVNLPAASPIARRLAGSLTIDSSRLRARIGPMPFTLDDGLADTAKWFLAARKGVH